MPADARTVLEPRSARPGHRGSRERQSAERDRCRRGRRRRVSGTNASAPKKANAIAEVAATTAGRPGASRRLPAGSRWRSAPIASHTPPMASPTLSGMAADGERPEHAVEPTARRTASRARRASLRPCARRTLRRRPAARAAGRRASAHDEHRRHDRQEDPAPADRVGDGAGQRRTDQSRARPRRSRSGRSCAASPTAGRRGRWRRTRPSPSPRSRSPGSRARR